MVTYNEDTSQTVTAKVIVAEGFGDLLYIEFYNLTRDPSRYDPYAYYYSTVTETWIWDPEQIYAYAGETLEIIAGVQNNGVGDSTIYTEFGSAQVTPNESSRQEGWATVGDWVNFKWTFLMPSMDVTVTFWAGHVTY